MVLALLAATFVLAYANGANDNPKGVASLIGSGTMGFRGAIRLAAVTTVAGSLVSVFLARSLLARFSGAGLVNDEIAGTAPLLFAVAVGAGVAVASATRLGLPISTTHALTGALVGSALVATGSGISLGALGAGFLLPLALSPLAAIALTASLHFGLSALRRRLGITKEWCLCVGETREIVPIQGPASVLAMRAGAAVPLSVSTGRATSCTERYAGRFLSFGAQSLVDAAHVSSASLVSFARGLNDTPKVAALLLAAQALDVRSSALLVGIAMAAGGLLSARRVAATMSRRITPLTHGQGLAANASTALLVVLASTQGLPVSTTHVSVGSLVGIGATEGTANLRVLSAIAGAWVFTLPSAAVVGALVYALAT
jgi:PiT family inorganic phosphate transporter